MLSVSSAVRLAVKEVFHSAGQKSISARCAVLGGAHTLSARRSLYSSPSFETGRSASKKDTLNISPSSSHSIFPSLSRYSGLVWKSGQSPRMFSVC